MTDWISRRATAAARLTLVLALILLSGGASLAGPDPAANPAGVMADPIAVRVDPVVSYPLLSEVFDVEVWIDGAVDLGGFEFYMSFDPSLVQIVEDPPGTYHVALGPFLLSTGRDGGALGPTVDNTAGTLQFGGFSFGDEAGAAGSGLLATITLEGVGLGTSALHLYDVQVLDTQAQAQVFSTVDGSAEVHDHWGETWSGPGTGLTLQSSDGTGLKGVGGTGKKTTYGVYGRSKSSEGVGTYGYAGAAGGETYCVRGLSQSNGGRGVLAVAEATSGDGIGVYGRSDSVAGVGVYGYASNAVPTSYMTYGVYGESKSRRGGGSLATPVQRAGSPLGCTERASRRAVLGYTGTRGPRAGERWVCRERCGRQMGGRRNSLRMRGRESTSRCPWGRWG